MVKETLSFYHYDEDIPYRQTLQINGIYLDTFSFDKTIKTPSFTGNVIFERLIIRKGAKKYKEQKVTYFRYYPVLQIVKEIVKDLHILLTHDNTHNFFLIYFQLQTFRIIMVQKTNSFAVLPMLNKEVGSCKCLLFS